MTSFRSFLARERLVPVEQLDRALQRQILYGEDLSVNLLEMGVVAEDELAQFLGMFHRLPIVSRSDLQSVAPQLLARVPSALALRHRVCPVALADNSLVVAASRQLEKAAVEELHGATGLDVSFAIATPVTLAWGLHLHYGAELPTRFQRLIDRQGPSGPATVGKASMPTPAPEPPTEEVSDRPRRISGVILMPGDLPTSAQAALDLAGPTEVRSTPEASMPPAPVVEPAVVEPPREEAEATAAVDQVLRGVSLSHDSAADRLLEMVLGPPSEPPPPPDTTATDDDTEERVTTEPGVSPPFSPPVEQPLQIAAPPPAAAPMPGVSPQPTRTPAVAEKQEAAVTRVTSVVLGTGEDLPSGRTARPATMPRAVEAILQSAPAAPGPRGDLMGRIQRIDSFATPTEVLRYSFQLFSAAFRVGMLFDTTARNPRLRDAFGVRTRAEGYRGRELSADVVPSTVRTAGQPLLAPIDPEGALASLLRELFGDVPANGLFLPVTVGPRVVAVLYGDNRETATSFDNVRDLFHLSWAAGTRLGDLVRRRHHLAPGEAAADDVSDTERGVPPTPSTT